MPPDDKRDPRLDSMGSLAALMYTDPEMKAVMDQWTEAKLPGTQGRLQTAKAVAEARTLITKDRDDFKAEIEREKSARARERELERIKNNPELRIRDEEIPELEQWAVERGIGNWEDAAYRWRQLHTIAAPAPPGVQHGIDLNDINAEGSKWLAPAFGKDGIVNHAVLDRVTRKMKDTILGDYAKDPIGAERRWGGG